MNRNVSYTCVLVGGQSLLIECGERLIKAGHKIYTVISDDPAVAAWAKGQEIQLFAFDQNNLHKVAQDQFDYLFSIANLKILPEALIRAAKKLAINFHDGRLPDYAGLNTPTWAILNREKEFAINWHVMTDEVDKGDVLESLPVTIDDNDTSLSMNIKCFEVGIQAFEKLLRDIELGSLQPIRQDLAGYQFYAKCQRPQAASTIDWNCAAEDIDALIRGLNFGSYWNPLGMPKLYLGKVIALVDRLELTDRTSTQTPGTILSVHDDLEVSTKTFDVIVRHLRTLDGQPIAARDMIGQAGLQQNVTLPALSVEQTNRLTELDSQACLAEQHDGWHLRVETAVAEQGFNRRRLLTLTGLDAQENQARRLLNDIELFRERMSWVEGIRPAEQVGALRWLVEVFQPTIELVPEELRTQLEPAELFHQILEHRWFMSEAAERDVGRKAAVADYIERVLRHRPDERSVVEQPTAEVPVVPVSEPPE